MVGERVLKVVLVLAGLLFVAGVYPLVVFFSKDPGVPMIMSIYVTLGIFLLLSAREPMAHRSLIAFAGWANIAHASVMAVQVSRHMIEHTELAGVLIFATVGIALVALTPSKRSRTTVTAPA